MIGTEVGPYRVLAQIGEGGMGKVYRARDTRLNRDVALKVLPDQFAADPDRLARFEREAQLLAALNHPNIAAIYGLEVLQNRRGASAEHDGRTRAHCIVMEFVDGEDLAHRIGRGRLAPGDALPIARQIAEALEAAHETGIVHRDLKPANIKLRDDGAVKVLDFGLAKALSAESSRATTPGSVSLSPTLTSPVGTGLGVVLGTAPYMSPEQARGRRADARSDIWAFGCVLYEMLSGSRAFPGDEPSDTMAAVIKSDPDWSFIPASTPRALVRLIRRCLAKDPRQRLQAAGDVRIELEEIAAAGSADPGDAAVPLAARGGHRWRIAAAVAAAAAALLALALVRARAEPADAPAVRAAIPLPRGLHLDGAGPPPLALSPDGRTLAFLARDQSAFQRLYVRRLSEDAATLVPDSETAEGPFFSPDGRWIAFAVGTSISGVHPPELRKFSLDTGLTQSIGAVGDYFGGYWSDDQSIVYVGVQPDGLYTIPAGGGAAEPLISEVRIDGKDQPRSMGWPEPLPGRAALITDWGSSSIGTLAVLDLETRELTSLGVEGSGARLASGGYIVYAAANASLMAARFDLDARRIVGTPVALMSDVAFGRNNAPAFALSPSGVFAFATGYLRYSRREPLRIVKFTRDGAASVPPFDAQLFRRGFALSPAGDLLAAGTWDEARWMYDLARMTRAKMAGGGTLEPAGIAWSPDGRRLAFAGPVLSNTSVWSAFTQSADGVGAVEPLGTPVRGEIHVAGWLPDNKTVVAFTFTTQLEGTSFVRIAIDGTEERLFTERGSVASAKPSPDGRWLAFDSIASGNFDVYIAPLSGPMRRVTASQASGARFPIWSRDGRELYFRRDRAVVAVALSADGEMVRVGPERVLFEWNVDANREFAVNRTGEFYAVEIVPGAAEQTMIQLHTNWLSEVERLVGR